MDGGVATRKTLKVKQEIDLDQPAESCKHSTSCAAFVQKSSPLSHRRQDHHKSVDEKQGGEKPSSKQVKGVYDAEKVLFLDEERRLARKALLRTHDLVDSPSRFETEKKTSEFSPKQVWALYDDMNGYPRVYAKISKVWQSPFRVAIRFQRLHAPSEEAKQWSLQTGLPVTSGRFKCGDYVVLNHMKLFSHKIQFEAGEAIRIYPRTGEIWAMYRNWQEISKSRLTVRYAIVEVKDGFKRRAGVCVEELERTQRDPNLWCKKFATNGRRNIISRTVSPDALHTLAFRIPAHHVLDGTQMNDSSGQCWELDPRCTPNDVDKSKSGASVQPKEELDCKLESADKDYISGACISPVLRKERGFRYTEERRIDDSSDDKENVVHVVDVKTEPQETQEVMVSPRIIKHEKDQFWSPMSVPAMSSHTMSDESFFEMVATDGPKVSVRPGQVWAVGEASICGKRLCYCEIVCGIQAHNSSVCVAWLRPYQCSQAQASQQAVPLMCGDFESADYSVFILKENLSYFVEVEETRGVYSIYPKRGEVWIIFNKVVEIMSEFHGEVGFITAPLEKLEGSETFWKLSDSPTIWVGPGEVMMFTQRVSMRRTIPR